jgi:hypothetical protein
MHWKENRWKESEGMCFWGSSGICRGCQLVNVAMGGTLIQDLPPSCAPFHSCDGEGRDRVHTIRAEQDAPLYSLYGPLFPVTSHHHQALDRLGEGLRASAWSESGFPEAGRRPSSSLWRLPGGGRLSVQENFYRPVPPRAHGVRPPKGGYRGWRGAVPLVPFAVPVVHTKERPDA